MTIFLTVLLTLASVAFGFYAHIWYLKNKRMIESSVVNGRRYCDICHFPLPKGTVRTFNGKWRCNEHKHAA